MPFLVQYVKKILKIYDFTESNSGEIFEKNVLNRIEKAYSLIEAKEGKYDYESEDIHSDDKVVGLLLSKPYYQALAHSIAGQHKVSLLELKNPVIGFHINGTKSAVGIVKELIQSDIIDTAKKSIGEKYISIKPHLSPLLSATNFNSELCLDCSFPHENCASDSSGEDEDDNITITLRGPCLAERKIFIKINSLVSSEEIDKIPRNMTPAFRKKLHYTAKKNCVMCSFRTVIKEGKQYEVLRIEGDSSKLEIAADTIREEIQNYISLPQFPSEWEQQTQETELFQVTGGSPEWQDVKRKFTATMTNSSIHVITRIQNKWQWEKYSFQKSRLERKNNGHANEMQLFRGTRKNDPKLIYEGEDGFDMRYGKEGMWGVANYFAVKASYSDDYAHTSSNGQKEIFLVNVLTGDSYPSSPDGTLRMPPIKTIKGQGDNVKRKYDTVKGHACHSDVFMTYDNEKAYPAYLIAYT